MSGTCCVLRDLLGLPIQCFGHCQVLWTLRRMCFNSDLQGAGSLTGRGRGDRYSPNWQFRVTNQSRATDKWLTPPEGLDEAPEEAAPKPCLTRNPGVCQTGMRLEGIPGWTGPMQRDSWVPGVAPSAPMRLPSAPWLMDSSLVHGVSGFGGVHECTASTL